MTLEGNNLLQLQKWCYASRSDFCQYMSTKKILPPQKKPKSQNDDITKFILPPETHYKYVTERENLKHYQEYSELILLKIPLYHNKKNQNNM